MLVVGSTAHPVKDELSKRDKETLFLQFAVGQDVAQLVLVTRSSLAAFCIAPGLSCWTFCAVTLHRGVPWVGP